MCNRVLLEQPLELNVKMGLGSSGLGKKPKKAQYFRYSRKICILIFIRDGSSFFAQKKFIELKTCTSGIACITPHPLPLPPGATSAR